MEGYEVMTMDEAAPLGDFFVTVTGCKDVITAKHFLMMKNGAVCCNAGHFDCEVSMKDIKKMAVSETELRHNVVGYKLENGNTVCIIAEGRLVNLASGDGHPVEIMDMSFALQAQSAMYIAMQKERLPIDVYQTPEVIDNRVAEILLDTKKIKIDVLTEEQKKYISSWEF
jgi:adenosylhomocysteinase